MENGFIKPFCELLDEGASQCRSLHATGWNYILDTILRILMNNELIALKFYSSSSLKHYPLLKFWFIFFVAVILGKLNMGNDYYTIFS